MTTKKPKSQRGLSVWHPFKDVEEIERRFEDFFGLPFLPALRRFYSERMGWSPAIEISEKGDGFVVNVELPGVKEDDVDVSIIGNMLTVSGEKHTESEVNKKGYHYTERSHGSFSRLIALPSVVDAGKIEANYDKGILEIVLPKSTEVKPKKITVATKAAEKAAIKKEEPKK
jgi:HSP20 family protein